MANNWLNYYWGLCRLKALPQDAPGSRISQYIAVLLYFVTGAIVTMFSQTFSTSMLVAALQTGLLLFVIQMALWIKKMPERIPQTITASAGTAAVIAVIAMPLLIWVSQAGMGSENVFMVFWLVLVVWETAILGHILRHSLEISLIAGLGVSLLFMYLSFTITLRLLKTIAIFAS